MTMLCHHSDNANEVHMGASEATTQEASPVQMHMATGLQRL
jgi:hypothetical protein